MSYITLITNAGLAKITAALGSGNMITMGQIAVGDGNGSPTIPSQTQTGLVHEVYRANANQIAINADGKLVAELLIPQTVGGFTVREIGLYDADGDLFAYGSTPALQKPTLAENAAAEMIMRLIVEISNSSVIAVSVNSSIIATRDWVEANFAFGAQFPGGTVGQILAKKSNVDGDTEWKDPTTVNVTVDVIEESQTLTAIQTVVVLATTTTTGLAVYVDGIRLPRSRYSVNSATQITLTQTYPAGTIITLVQNEPSAQIQAVPIGQIVMLGLSANPSTLFGYGTWARVAEGRALFGYNASDADFNELGKIGGQKLHAHSGTTESAGNHNHGGSTGNAGSHSHSGATQGGGGHTHGGNTGAGGDHNHGGTSGSTILTLDQIPSHTHNTSSFSGQGSTLISEPWEGNYGGGDTTSASGGGGGHNHTISASGTHVHSIAAAADHAHSITADGVHGHTIGGDGTHTHVLNTAQTTSLPPYFTVALWQRTA
jgi:hypothetical protein